jgi:hypothetical protein
MNIESTNILPLTDGNSSHGALLRTLCSDGKKMFWTAVWFDASIVCCAASNVITHRFDKAVNVYNGF